MSEGGSFLRIRTLNFAVEYAGIRVRETTTAADTIALVSSKLRLDAKEQSRRKIVMVYRMASERGRRGKARWRIRTLGGDEALLPLRRNAAARYVAITKGTASPTRRDAANFADTYSSTAQSRDEVRFYLHDESSIPLDCTELPEGEDASGSESSDDERPPQAKYVADRQALAAKASINKIGTLLKRSEKDQNLWRRRICVLVDDRLWYWRDTILPSAKTSARGGCGGLKEESDDTIFKLDTKNPDTIATKKKKRGLYSSAGTTTAARHHKPSQLNKPAIIDTRTSYDPYELEYDRIIRSRAACIPLASNIVTEISGKRDIPHGIEISTASRTLIFRAHSRTAQLDWLEHIRTAIDLATQNEYIALAQLIISDEQALNTDAFFTEYRKNKSRVDHSCQQDSAYFRRRHGLPIDTEQNNENDTTLIDDHHVFSALAKVKETLREEATLRENKYQSPSRVVVDDHATDPSTPNGENHIMSNKELLRLQ